MLGLGKMRRVEKVRFGLIAGSVLLLVVLAGMFGYARYRAGKVWIDRLKARSGVTIERETDHVTYSQSVRGRTVFTLRAAKGFAHTDGTWTLHDVVITLYGANGDRADRLSGKQFEWDEKKGIARAVGEVQMELAVPSGVTSSQRRGSPATADAEDKDRIHVRTSGLVFVRELDVAATQEDITFEYGGLVCTAHGAEFTNSPSLLHLLSNVRMAGVMRGQPVTMTAARADFDRGQNVASFAMPVVTSAESTSRAKSAVLHLRKDGSVERAEADGDVALDSAGRHVTAPRLEALLDAKNQPQTARFSGGVKMSNDGPERPAQGEAGEVRVRFDGHGQAQEVTAVNAAHVAEKERGTNGVWLEREMRGEQLVGTLRAEGKERPVLQQVRALGGASVRGDAVTKGAVKTTTVSGDDLLLSFLPPAATALKGRTLRLDRLHAQGKTVLRQTAALGEEHVSSGDMLDAVFGRADAGQVAVASATQVGHVAISDRAAAKPGVKKTAEAATGSADRLIYDVASEKLALSGGVHVADNGTALTADAVVFDQRTGDAEARGNIAATLAGNGTQMSHAAAELARMHKATQVVEFEGTAGRLARLWQESSQVEAALITLDRAKNTLAARPNGVAGTVRSVFQGQAAKAGERAPGLLRVESRMAEYSEADHQAVFSGPVKLDGALGEIHGEKTTVYFVPGAKGAQGDAIMGGALDRAVVAGDVKLDQTGRHGVGDRLVYKAADGSFVLTGTASQPPRIADAQQGTVTGTSLLFRAGDSTIVVSGAAPGEQHTQRAHIETHMRQKTE